MRTCGGCAPGVFSSKAILPLLSVLLRRGLLSVCARCDGAKWVVFTVGFHAAGEPHNEAPWLVHVVARRQKLLLFKFCLRLRLRRSARSPSSVGDGMCVGGVGTCRRARLAPTRPLASELNEGAPGSGVNAGTEMPGLACAAPRLYNLTHAHFTAGGSWNGERAQRVTQTHCDGAEGMGR